MLAIRITVVIGHIVDVIMIDTTQEQPQNVLKAFEGENSAWLGILGRPPPPRPAVPLQIVTLADLGSGRKSPFLLQISLARPS